jgi:hypothetical protein
MLGALTIGSSWPSPARLGGDPICCSCSTPAAKTVASLRSTSPRSRSRPSQPPPRTGRPGRRGTPSSSPAAGRAAQPRLTGDDALVLALGVCGVAVQLRVAPLGGGCPLRPVSLRRLGVPIVSGGASLTRCSEAERSLRPLPHLACIFHRLPGALLGAPQATPVVLIHAAPLSRRPQQLEAQGLRTTNEEPQAPSRG